MIGFLICEHLRTDHLLTREPYSYDKAKYEEDTEGEGWMTRIDKRSLEFSIFY